MFTKCDQKVHCVRMCIRMVLRRIRLVILLLDHIKVCTSNPLHDVIVHTLNSSWQQQGAGIYVDC